MLIASLVASTIALIVFILPAEFDSDPTGLGEMMGIKGMSGYSVGAFSEQDLPFHSDERVFELAPFESLEYKYRLEAGQSMSFSWTASTMTSESAEVLFDFHSEEDGTDPEDAVELSSRHINGKSREFCRALQRDSRLVLGKSGWGGGFRCPENQWIL